VVTLLLGTSISQAIPVAISPILTRLYTPSDLGVLALFVVVTSVIGVFANGGFELAIMLPFEDSDSLNIAAAAQLAVIIVSSGLFVAMLLFRQAFADALGDPALAGWLLLTPLAVMLSGTFTTLNYYSSRGRRFRAIAEANVARAIAGATTQVVAGLASQGAAGLILGQTAASGAANIRLARASALSFHTLRLVSWSGIRHQAYVHRDFPKYAMTSGLANSLSQNIANVLLAAFYSVSTLGHYALMRRVLGMPINLVANSVGQVFYQAAIEQKREIGNARCIFRQTAGRLTITSIIIFVPLYFAVQPLFAVVFGPEWKEAGHFAQIVAPSFAVRFVVMPLTMANPLNMKNRLELCGNLTLLTITVVVIVASGYLNASATHMLSVLTWGQCAYYLGFVAAIYHHVSKAAANHPDD
jgi:O-antigen/teichoic acid export membrane protein